MTLLTLPNDVVATMCAWLSPAALGSFAATCKRAKAVVDTETHW